LTGQLFKGLKKSSDSAFDAQIAGSTYQQLGFRQAELLPRQHFLARLKNLRANCVGNRAHNARRAVFSRDLSRKVRGDS
jgi:hypothetical protein